MNRRQFIRYTAATGIIASFDTVRWHRGRIEVEPSGGDDTAALNAALAASSRTGSDACLMDGKFTISSPLAVPGGARLIGQKEATPVEVRGDPAYPPVRFSEGVTADAVSNLLLLDDRGDVSIVALVG